MEVFVSWRGADRELKDRVTDALRRGLGSEVTVWESDGGCSSRSLEECAEAVKRCDVFVIIVSDETQKPSYVDSELTLAHEREMSGECNMIMYRTTDKPLTGFLSMHLCNTFDANHVARLAGTDDGISVLTERVKRLLQSRSEGTPERPFDVHVPVIAGGELGEDRDLVEGSRDDVLLEIDNAFKTSRTVFICRSAGYGKRTLAKEYKFKNKACYTDTPYLHQFKGSLRTLLLDGIEFKNVNPAYFNGDNDNKTIQKKTELLKKLNTDTLVIVPGVRPDPKTDNDFVLDSFDSLGCRMLLLAEWVPEYIRERFPVIDLPDLSGECLRELFYTSMNISEYDRTEELDQSLNSFFTRIGNNTLAIKLTAAALNDEIGLYPEDIPERLDNMIRGECDNELDSVLSSLYDLEDHTPEEQQILYIASLCAEIPLDERTFSELLDLVEIDPKLLRPLCEGGWLIRDVATRTISIDPLLAAVSFTKFSAEAYNLSLNESVFCFFKNEMDILAFKANAAGYFSNSKRLEGYFRRLDVTPFADLCALSYSVVSGDSYSSERFERIREACRDYVDGEENIFYDINEELVEFIEFQSSSIKVNFIAEELADRSRDTDVTASLASSLCGEDFISGILSLLDAPILEELTEDTAHSFKSICQALKDGDLSTVPQHVVNLSESIEKDRISEECACVICPCISSVLLLFMMSSSISETLALSAIKILDKAPRGFEAMQATGYQYLLLSYYLRNVCDERAEDALMRCIALNQTSNHLIKFAVGAPDPWFDADYVITPRLSFGDSDGAISLFKKVEKAVKGKKLNKHRLGYVRHIVNTLIDEARLEEARAFLVAAIDTKEKSCDAESRDILEELNETLRLLSFKENSKGEEGEKYKGYYESYESSVDRKLNARYSSLAEIAGNIDLSSLSKAELIEKTAELRTKATVLPKESIIPEALALISEAGVRTLGYRHHHTQLMGAIAIFEGHIAELQNGEGKTYVIAMAAFLHYVFGTPVTVIDKSLYLATRNYNWMRGTLGYLGLSVALLDSTKKSEIENAHNDVIYACFRAAAFEQLYKELFLKGYNYDPTVRAAIVDEADDLMISAPNAPCNVLSSSDSTKLSGEQLERIYNIVLDIPAYAEDYFSVKKRNVQIKDTLLRRALFELGFSSPSYSDINMVNNALRITVSAQRLWKRDEDYFVLNGKLWFEENGTGTMTEYSGIHAFVLAKKEGLSAPIEEFKYTDSYANATTVYQYLSLYGSLAGATATAVAVKAQFESLYNKKVVSIPTHSPVLRVCHSPCLYRTEGHKSRAVVETVREKNLCGQPVMVICSSIPEAKKYSKLLREEGIAHNLLTGESALGKEREDATILGSAGKTGAVTVCTAVANRGVDIVPGGDPLRATVKHLEKLGYTEENITSALYTRDGDCEVVAAREKAAALLSYYRAAFSEDRENVLSLGGLCVIGTECFPNLSTEQQVIGRCARQGAPGESFMFFALDDPAIDMLLGRNAGLISGLLEKTGVDFIDVSSGGIVSISKALRKGRERWNKANLNYNLDAGVERLYPAAKEAIFGARDLLYSGQADMFDFIEKTLTGDEALAARLRTLSGGGTVFGGRLDELLKEKKPPNKSSVGRVVADSYRTLFECGEIPESAKPSLLNLLIHELSHSFEKYIRIINEFVSKTRFITKANGAEVISLAQKESRSVALELKRECIKKLLSARIQKRAE